MQPRSRLLRELAERDEHDDVLADFCALLIDALAIPEVAAALAAAVAARAAPDLRTRPAPTGNSRVRRGHR